MNLLKSNIVAQALHNMSKRMVVMIIFFSCCVISVYAQKHSPVRPWMRELTEANRIIKTDKDTQRLDWALWYKFYIYHNLGQSPDQMVDILKRIYDLSGERNDVMRQLVAVRYMADLYYYTQPEKQSDKAVIYKEMLEQLPESEDKQATVAYITVNRLNNNSYRQLDYKGRFDTLKKIYTTMGVEDDDDDSSTVESINQKIQSLMMRNSLNASNGQVALANSFLDDIQFVPEKFYYLRGMMLMFCSYVYSHVMDIPRLMQVERMQRENMVVERSLTPLRDYNLNLHHRYAYATINHCMYGAFKMDDQQMEPAFEKGFVEPALKMFSQNLSYRYNREFLLNENYVFFIPYNLFKGHAATSVNIATHQMGIQPYRLDLQSERLKGLRQDAQMDSDYVREAHQLCDLLTNAYLDLNSEGIRKTMEDLQQKFTIDSLQREQMVHNETILANNNTFKLARNILLIVAILIVALAVYSLLKVQHYSHKVKRMRTEVLHQTNNFREEADLKNKFLTDMREAIQNPLNSIVSTANLIAEPELSKELTTEEVAELNKRIHDSSYYLTRTVNNTLEISRIESGQVEITFNVYVMSRLIKEAFDMNQTATKEGVKMILDTCEEDVSVSTDHFRFMQLMENLISNAQNFTNEGEIHVGYHVNRDKEHVEIYVEDTGIGIHSRLISQCMHERFFKIDPLTNGTGLGLPLCLLIAEKLNGRISAKSVFGEGSTFMFIMPYKEILQSKEQNNEA